MAEEIKAPAEEVPVQAVPVQTVPVQAEERREDPGKSRKGSPLLVFLTVLLVLVGIADLILWSVVGYYFLLSRQSGSGGALVQVVSAAGAPAGDAAASGGGEGREELLSYIQEMSGVMEQENAVLESYGSVSGANYTDDNAMYTEVSQHTIPLCQELNEKVLAIAPSDAEIAEAHEIYRDYITKHLNAYTMLTSALSSQDAAQASEANDLINEANDLAVRYQQALRSLAEERDVPLN